LEEFRVLEKFKNLLSLKIMKEIIIKADPMTLNAQVLIAISPNVSFSVLDRKVTILTNSMVCYPQVGSSVLRDSMNRAVFLEIVGQVYHWVVLAAVAHLKRR